MSLEEVWHTLVNSFAGTAWGRYLGLEAMLQNNEHTYSIWALIQTTMDTHYALCHLKNEMAETF